MRVAAEVAPVRQPGGVAAGGREVEEDEGASGTGRAENGRPRVTTEKAKA